MAFSPVATYKGRPLTNMSRAELIQALEDQLKEAVFMSRFVDAKAWREALRTRDHKPVTKRSQ